MLICLWKGCEFASEEFAAFQEHVITKHAQQQQQSEQQQQQLNLDNKNNVGKEGEKLGEEGRNQNENKMIKREENRKIIFLAIEVWVDVLGFIKRLKLARSISLTNQCIHQICWPRLHGDKVRAHPVVSIFVGCRHELGQPPTAFLLKHWKQVPFPECPPPGYITTFEYIQINFLDHQVLTFLSLIADRIKTDTVRINFEMKTSDLVGNQLASLNQLFQLCGEKITTISSINFNGNLSNIQFLPDVDNKMGRIECSEIEETDIQILMKFLTSPRPDGQQRVIRMYFRAEELPLAQKLLDDIKEDFRTSILPVPQPFCLSLQANLNMTHSVEQNQKTNETLTIVPSNTNWCSLDIYRHPRGQHEQWAEDAGKRLIEWPIDESMTSLFVDISVDMAECG